MPPAICSVCQNARAQILRPRNKDRCCSACFISLFESEVAETIIANKLFQPYEKVAIGASGGKDSTVLASVMKTLNERHDWKLDLSLLSIDEGIQGYRDHSLEAVKRNSADLDLPLKIVSYAELYGWSMDQVVAQVGKKGNCTYCGVFRRQALDRGAAMLGVGHVVTGHNVDDVAETVLMNLLRGDLPRLSRGTSIVTSTPSAVALGVDRETKDTISFTDVKRSKPLMYAYEKEIVLYAHHKKLDYFSTECIYSPEAFRGSARTLIKSLERIRPESILDVVQSGVDMAKLVPNGGDTVRTSCGDGETTETNKRTESSHASDADSNGRLVVGGPQQSIHACATNGENEVEVTLPIRGLPKEAPIQLSTSIKNGSQNILPIRVKLDEPARRQPRKDAAVPTKQKLGQCERCGYLSSQPVCKACVLLEGLNKARPRTGIQVGDGS